MKTLYWALKTVLLLSPALILAYWSYAYVRECLQLLSAPNKPLEIAYKAPAGQVRIRFASYVADLRHGRLTIYQPSIFDPGGGVLATANTAVLSELNWRRGADQIVQLKIDHLSGRLIRLPNGKFELSELLPPRKGPPSNIAFHVQIQRADLTLIDRSGGEEWRQVAYSPAVTVSGVGSDWLANGSVVMPSIGSADGVVQSVQDQGIHVHATTPGLTATGLIRHLLRTPDAKKYLSLAKLSLDSAFVSGPFDVFVPISRGVEIAANVRLIAKGVSYDGNRVDDASFAGALTASGARGLLSVKDGATAGTFTGSGSWKSGESAEGKAEVTIPAPSALPAWVQRKIPKGLDFRNGRYSGWISFGKNLPSLAEGSVEADLVTYRAQTVRNAIAQIQASQNLLRVRLQRGFVGTLQPQGALSLDLHTKDVRAFLSLPNANLEAVGQLLKTTGLRGNADLYAVLTGPIANPNVHFSASGRATYRGPKNSLVVGPERVDVTGTFEKGLVAIDRGVVAGKSGLVVATGHLSQDGKRLAMHLVGRGIRPGAFVSDLSGTVGLSASVTGTLENPNVSGRVEGYDLSYKGQVVPATTVDFVANRSTAVAKRVEAVSGTTFLTGRGSYVYSTKAVSGRFGATGIQLTDYLGPNVAGDLDAPKIVLGGTVANPTVQVQVEGHNLVAQQIKIDDLYADLGATRNEIVLKSADAKLAHADAHVQGSYSLDKKHGELTATSTGLHLADLAPELGEEVTIDGTAAVTMAKAVIDQGKISATARGRLDAVRINGATAGDGNWTVTNDGPVTHATLSIGEVIPQLRVVDIDATYNQKNKDIQGTFQADRARIKDLIAASERYLPLSVTSDQARLESFTGDLTIGAKFSGSLSQANLSFDTLKAENLLFANQSYGTLTANGLARQNGVWTVPPASLSGPAGTVKAQGKIEEDGKIALTASGDQLKISALAPFAPSLASNPGLAKFSLSATGDARRPDLAGSAEVNHLAKASAMVQSNATESQDLLVRIPTISVSEKGGAHVKATYAYSGFGGSIFLDAPFSYSQGLAGGKIKGGFVLDDRSLTELPLLNDYLDPIRTSGHLGGTIEASGTVDNMRYSGGLTMQAKSLGFRFASPTAYLRRMDDSLKDVTSSVKLGSNGRLIFDGKATEQRGGAIVATVSTSSLDSADLLSGNLDPLLKGLLNSPLTGKISLDHFQFRQAAPGGYVAGQVSGAMDLTGSVSKPAFGTRADPGSFTVSQLDTTIPTLPPSSGQGGALSIDPAFDIAVALATEAHVRSATADLYLTGDGSLRGSLSDPRALADLVVQKGTIRLPGGTVRLEQGGTVDFTYRNAFGDSPAASLQVDLAGTTSITAIRYGENTQRYNISLDITGDLLKQQGLQMQAISDPPDLSSDDVLALLGEKNLFESLGTNTTAQSETQRRLTDALAGFALPNLLDPVTAGIAKNLGLDYVTLEYNEVDLTTLSLARSLTPEISLQYRTQIGTPTPGYRPIYDFRLVYSPRRVPGVLRRFTLSAGFDQDRPWKVAIEYGVRFGGPPAGKPVRKVLISP